MLLFFQSAGTFGTRYGHIGFNDVAQLDEGSMWPTAYAITRWTKTNEAAVEKLVRQAVGG